MGARSTRGHLFYSSAPSPWSPSIPPPPRLRLPGPYDETVTLSLLREMRLRNPPNGAAPLPVPDVISFNIALAACARAGRTALTLSLLDEMIDDSNGSSRAGLIGGAGYGGWGGGVDGFGGGRDDIVEVLSPAPSPNLASYNSALSACGRCESEKEGLEQAFEILEAMRRGDGGAPSPDMVTYKELIIACGR